VLGVNILGKFLTNRDNNIRYVALNTLMKVVAIEPNAVQRHRNTILDCLRDPDISIRRRALDLSFTLINVENVRVLTRELLAFLEVADNEFKPVLTSQIGIAADRFAPQKRWHIDTMLRVLKLAGNYVKEQILSSFIRLIATTPELQTYAVQKLYASLKEDITQDGLTLAGAWVIGEYGDLLLRGGQYEEEELVIEVKESDIIDLFTTILNSSYSTQVATEYIITAVMKLTTRLSEPAQVDRIRRLLLGRTDSLDVEIQQRAVEYGNLFAYDTVRQGVLEKMPAPEIREEQRVLGQAPSKKAKAAPKKKALAAVDSEQQLLDLMIGDDNPVDLSSPTNDGAQSNADMLADILGGGPSGPAPQAIPSKPQSNVDSIMDLFGSSSTTTTTAAAAVTVAATKPQPMMGGAGSGNADLLGGLSGLGGRTPSSAAPAASGPAAHAAYSKNRLELTLQLQRNAEGLVQILARFRNTDAFERISGLGLQAAVPKTQKLQLQALSTTELDGGEEATQQMRVVGSKGVSFFFFFFVFLRVAYAGAALLMLFRFLLTTYYICSAYCYYLSGSLTFSVNPATAEAPLKDQLHKGWSRRRHRPGRLVGAQVEAHMCTAYHKREFITISS
jgi:AP-1 complex subunit gamma-1